MKLAKLTIQIFGWCLIVFGCMWLGWLLRDAQEQLAPTKQLVPTVREIQLMVGAVPDGIIGQETLAKWDKVICQQEYEKSLELMRGVK